MSRGDEDDRDDRADDEIDHDPLPEDQDDFDEPSLSVCPQCRKMINEDAEQCHHCGHYLSGEDAPSHTPLWIFIVAGVLLLIFAFSLL